jgi:hypothetical protein
MTYLHTCRTCALPPKTCPTRATIAKALTALGVRSAKHYCVDFKPLFQPGDAVTVEARAWVHGEHAHYDDEPPFCRYQGRFIQYSGTRALVFVAPGSEALNDEYTLESATGFLKVTMSRIWPSDWSEPIDVSPCRECYVIPTIGQPCGRDLHYGARHNCKAEKLGLLPGPAASTTLASGKEEVTAPVRQPIREGLKSAVSPTPKTAGGAET